MMTLLIIAVIVALIFDLVNGFHDAANSIATVVSTRVLRPAQAVVWAAFFNFIAMFIFAPHVADTLSKIVKIQPNEITYVYLVFSGLVGAIIWDLLTWWLGLPTSSSHALIGGMAGAGVMCAGWGALQWDILIITAIFIVLAPCLGFIIGIFLELILSWLLRYQKPLEVDSWFRKGQLLSAGLYSIGHGANDAQKTMGVILALLIAGGVVHPKTELSLYHENTLWIILSCQLAMAIGTAFGGWRIIRTMGMRITKLKPIGGFCAETAGAATLFMATCWGIPVSTTHTITGAIMGVGSLGGKISAVRWGVAARIVWAWILTIPASALIAGTLFWVIT
ncbi:MAG TPA: inorganic phosphate transporter [Chlamydiales bacterium]|nr:inorganic phosphate transporter [Chlamydiales bacterium]